MFVLLRMFNLNLFVDEITRAEENYSITLDFNYASEIEQILEACDISRLLSPKEISKFTDQMLANHLVITDRASWLIRLNLDLLLD